MPEQAQMTPAERRRAMLIIWSSFCAAVLIYLLVLPMTLRQPPPAVPQAELFQMIFPLMAVALAGVSFWWRRRQSEELAQLSSAAMGVANAETLEKFQTACIVTWAFSEAVAIHGLVLAFLLQNLGVYLPFGAAGLVLLLIHRPMAWPQWEWLG